MKVKCKGWRGGPVVIAKYYNAGSPVDFPCIISDWEWCSKYVLRPPTDTPCFTPQHVPLMGLITALNITQSARPCAEIRWGLADFYENKTENKIKRSWRSFHNLKQKSYSYLEETATRLLLDFISWVSDIFTCWRKGKNKSAAILF